MRVPVLSKTTASIRPELSRASAPLTITPSWAPRPVPTMTASGVARPSAHGQEMISTATAAVNASSAEPPSTSHPAMVTAAMPITTGTNTDDTRSASRCTAARPPWASATSRTIWAKAVSAPTRVASTTSEPLALTVAPITSSPSATSTGTGSPVIIEQSTAEAPLTTRPSVAILSPGRTTNRMPTARSATGTSRPSSSRASAIPRPARARTASPERRVARASSHLPARTRVTIIAPVSK